LSNLDEAKSDDVLFAMLVELSGENEQHHLGMNGKIHREVMAGLLRESEVSTLLNVNRELLNSNRSLLTAISESRLAATKAADFSGLPATA